MLLLLVLACQRSAPPVPAAEAPVAVEVAAPSPVEWQAPLGHEHPWIGRIWSADDQAWIQEEALLGALRRADVVLLGEKHDNPDHHMLQARVIGALVQPGTPVLFEQLDLDDRVAGARSPAELAEAARWAESGWPDFALYEPVFAAVYEGGGVVVPAHPTRAQVQAVTSGGLESLSGADRDRLRLAPLSDAQHATLEQEIVDAHCGMIDAESAWPMVDAQVLKDATMASAIAEAGTPAILVAGGGHTRPDRGVPHHLDLDTATVLFREVRDGLTGIPTVDGEADYVWFTARLDDEDPCDRFREQLEEMRAPEVPFRRTRSSTNAPRAR